jgi:carboxyl-terminal processing protease
MKGLASLLAKHSYRSIDSVTALDILTRSKLDSLDCYARLYDSMEWKQMQADLAGSFGGIGVRVSETPDSFGYHVLGVFDKSPAERAGIRERDIIVTVDGIPAHSLVLDEFLGKMRGRAGTEVSLELSSNNGASLKVQKLIREVISTPSIRGAGREAGNDWTFTLADETTVGYIRLTYFTKATVSEFESAVHALSSAGASNLIIDLRGNTGGLLSAALGIADHLLDSGLMISIQDEAGKTEFTTATSGTIWNGKVAVIVDSLTLSSGEVLTAVLQDNNRALIIGERTYGKSSIQQLFPLPDSSAGISMTTSLFYPSSGHQIERRFIPADSTQGCILPHIHWLQHCTLESVAQGKAALEELDYQAEFAHVKIPVLSSKDDCMIRLACKNLLHDTK